MEGRPILIVFRPSKMKKRILLIPALLAWTLRIQAADDAEIMARMGFKPSEIKAQREKDQRDAADGTKGARVQAQQSVAAALAAKAQQDALDNAADERFAILGMNVRQVVKAWGIPLRINQSVTAAGISQQWVYPDSRYLYMDDGILRAIQGPVRAPPRPPEMIVAGPSLPAPLTMHRSW